MKKVNEIKRNCVSKKLIFFKLCLNNDTQTI